MYVHFTRKTIGVMIVVFVSACCVVYWLYTHPIVKSLSVMSSSMNESKEDMLVFVVILLQKPNCLM